MKGWRFLVQPFLQECSQPRRGDDALAGIGLAAQTGQDIGTAVLPFDDRAVARRVLEAGGEW